MVYAGGELPERRGCVDVLTSLAQAFPEMSPRRAPRRGDSDTGTLLQKDYKTDLQQATEMGCLSMVPWGTVAPYVRTELEAYITKMANLTLTLFKFGDTVRDITIEIGRQQVHSKKARKQGPRNKIARGIVTKISQWVLHCFTKYASRLGPKWFDGAKASLRRTAPQVDADDLTSNYVSQFEALGLKTPYSREMCPKSGEECNDWNQTVPGFWSHGAVSGQSLEHIIGFIDQAKAMIQPGDWRLMAQTAQVYGAAGFDSMGTIDNSNWDCEKVESRCEVHPSCARAAAQMLTYPWAGDKKYASSWGDKIKTWMFSKGKFDKDGFHSYCHTQGEGYCWAYTDCIKEMMKWLCHDEATADRCCPSPFVRESCKKDVNSDNCKVCIREETQNQALEEDLTNKVQGPGMPTIERQAPDAATLAWLHPTAEDEKQLDVEDEEKELASQCEVCTMLREMKQPQTGDAIWWMLVYANSVCESNVMFCGEVCGFHSGTGPFLKPDDLDDCEGWRNRCSEKCPNA